MIPTHALKLKRLRCKAESLNRNPLTSYIYGKAYMRLKRRKLGYITYLICDKKETKCATFYYKFNNYVLLRRSLKYQHELTCYYFSCGEKEIVSASQGA